MGFLAVGAGAAEGLDKVLERALLQQKFAEQMRQAKADETLRGRSLDEQSKQRADALQASIANQGNLTADRVLRAQENERYHRALEQDRDEARKLLATQRLDQQFNEMPSDGSQPFGAETFARFKEGGIIPGRMRPIGLPQAPSEAVGVPPALAAVDERADVPGTIANSPAPSQVQFTRAPSVADLKLKKAEDLQAQREARAQEKSDADIDAKIRQLELAAQNARTAGELAEARIALAHAQAEKALRPPATKASTGAEKSSLGFYNRAKDAADTISRPSAGGKSLEEQVASAGLASQLQGQYAWNVLQTDAQQVYRQAQRAFTEAKLRKESGAAISQSEYDNDAKIYFAQPGDSPKVIAQKKKMRETVLNGLKFQAGKAYQEFYGEPDAGGATGGTTEEWYRDATGKLVKRG
jgi:hypothetical protein